MGKNFYQVLGGSSQSTQEELKQAYRKLAKENHPDLHPGDKAAEERFKEIGEAWEVLGDPEKRRKYDQELEGPQTKQKHDAAGSKSAPVGKVNINEMMKGFGNIFTTEHYQQEAAKKAGKSPVDTNDLFEKFMNIKK